MRILHPETIKIASENDWIPKTVISHAWSEVFKFVKSGKKHPKMFIHNLYDLGIYLKMVYEYGIKKGCNLDIEKVKTLPDELQKGFYNGEIHADKYFDKEYLFSDAVSLYFKNINIFPIIYGDEWRKYIPVESYDEILRQINKHHG